MAQGLEIASISIKGLKRKQGVSCFPKKMVVGAVVSIDSSNQSAKRTAKIDKNGGTEPVFNFDGKFLTINPKDNRKAQQSLVIQLREKGFLCDKDIGQASVSIEELRKNCVNEEDENHVSCDLGTPSGKQKVTLDIKYVLWEPVTCTGSGDGAVGADHQYPTAPKSGVGEPPAAAAQPQTTSKFSKVAAGIATAAAVFNALVGLVAN